MRVLVLGATNLIGNNLLRAALEAGWETFVFDQRKRRRRHPALEGLAVEFAPGKPNDPDALRQAMAGCQVVFHTAGYVPSNSLHHQRRLDEARQHIGRVLQAAGEAQIGRLIYTSSASTIGRSDVPSRLPDEWNRYQRGRVPHPYWDAKLIQEEAVWAFGRQSGMPVVVLNPAEVVGPYDFDLRAARPLLKMAKRGARQYMPGRVSVADVRDVAQGHLAAVERGRPGERYLLAGHNITRQEMSAVMAHACKRQAPEQPLDLDRLGRWTRFSERLSCLGRPNRPFPLSYQVEALRCHNWYDSAKAREDLGYTNRPLLDTYRATLAWLKAMAML